jgi:hypothetical protein
VRTDSPSDAVLTEALTVETESSPHGETRLAAGSEEKLNKGVEDALEHADQPAVER